MTKPVWQLTRDEYLVRESPLGPGSLRKKISTHLTRRDYLLQEHRRIVSGAVYDDKPVPERVLADYPEWERWKRR